jgi:ankyrin repeat protein
LLIGVSEYPYHETLTQIGSLTRWRDANASHITTSRCLHGSAKMDLFNTLSPLAPLAVEATKFALKKATSPANDLAFETTANSIKAVRLRLSKDPTIDRAPALVAAASLGHLEILELLLEPPHKHRHSHEPQKIDPNVWSSGETPLLAAVKNHHLKTTKALLKAGAEPDLCPKTGTTPLQEAAGLGDIDIIEVLLASHADINHPNAAGDTALIIASRSGHSRTATFLVEHGAGIDIKDKKGNTALAVAAKHDRVEVVDALLKAGAEVRVRDRKGRTPLHRAVAGNRLLDGTGRGEREEIVKMLLRAGANPNAKDIDGKTAADRIGWLNGGEGLRRLLETRSKSWEPPPRDRQGRSRTF